MVDPVTGTSVEASFEIGGMGTRIDQRDVVATIDAGEQQSGRRLVVTIPARSTLDAATTTAADGAFLFESGAVEVRLAHFDRFVLGVHLQCGDRSTLRPGGDAATWQPHG